jgi:hypothetical protein
MRGQGGYCFLTFGALSLSKSLDRSNTENFLQQKIHALRSNTNVRRNLRQALETGYSLNIQDTPSTSQSAAVGNKRILRS